MRKIALLAMLTLLLVSLNVSATSQSLTEPWHPVREHLLALVSTGEIGSFDLWHSGVDEAKATQTGLMIRGISMQFRDEILNTVGHHLVEMVETDSSDDSFYAIKHHPDKPWAIVEPARSHDVLGQFLHSYYGVALDGDEWRVVVPMGATSWDAFDDFWSEAARQSHAGAPSVSGGNEWTKLDSNWSYRNASIQNDPYVPMFVVEMQRTGRSIEMAMLTVTLYDSNDRIVTTGMGTMLQVPQGGTRTVQFMLQGDPKGASSFRIQVDVEM